MTSSFMMGRLAIAVVTENIADVREGDVQTRGAATKVLEVTDGLNGLLASLKTDIDSFLEDVQTV